MPGLPIARFIPPAKAPSTRVTLRHPHTLAPSDFKVNLSRELAAEVAEIVNQPLEVINTKTVPKKADISLRGGKKLESAVLYIDMRESTSLTEAHTDEVAAKMYKVYLEGVVAIARAKYGHVRGFAGDKIMVLFDNENGLAVERAIDCAVWMQSYIEKKVSPVLKARYRHPVACGVGIDFGTYVAVRGGRKGNNDIIWAGKAANRASKFADNAKGGGIIVGRAAYNQLSAAAKKKFALVGSTATVYVAVKPGFTSSHSVPLTVRYSI